MNDKLRLFIHTLIHVLHNNIENKIISDVNDRTNMSIIQTVDYTWEATRNSIWLVIENE